MNRGRNKLCNAINTTIIQTYWPEFLFDNTSLCRSNTGTFHHKLEQPPPLCFRFDQCDQIWQNFATLTKL